MLDSVLLRVLGMVCLIVGISCGGLYYGHTRYKEGVRVTRLEWDADRATWQKALDDQKRTAQGMLIQAQADVDAAKLKADKVAAQQEKDYATYMAGTAALAAQYATRSLRFNAGTPAPGRGAGSGPAVSSATAQAQPAASAVVQLPDRIQQPLVALMVKAEDLRNAYRKCVVAVNGGATL